MSRIVWDDVGEKRYATGVRNAVLYVQDDVGAYPLGVPWNGITGITESPSGGEATPLYADDIKYVNLRAAEEFGATIEAYYSPDEFDECDGSKTDLATGISIGQQDRKTFGMCYRTTIGDDVLGNAKGYKLHLIYGASAAPSERAFSSINDSPDAVTFSWEVATTPVPVTGAKPTASLVIDSTKIAAAKLTALENILFGSEGVDPRLPLPNEIITLVNAA